MPSAIAQAPDQLIVHHRFGSSVCDSRNTAARAAMTDWLLFLDADDELAPGYLDAMRPFMKPSAPEVLLAPYVTYVAPNGTRTDPHIPNAGNWPDSNDSVTGTMIRRVTFERLGGWQDAYWPWSDWELWLRAAAQGIGRLHVPGAVYIAHQSSTGENSTLPRQRALKLHARVKRLHRQVWDAK